MNISLKGFTQLIQDMSAALQSSSATLVDVSVGSVVRAIFEANASVVLWMQWLILQVLQTTRAATSTGPDLDSWMIDFGVMRLPAVQSSGIVTFARFAPNLSANIPLGSVVKTGDGLLSFAVVQDNTNSIWSQSSGGYVIPAGVVSADVPVACTGAGVSGNVLPGTISVIAASLPGIDQVSNAVALINGHDAEADQAFRSRFQDFLASRSRATLAAIRNAIAGVRQGLNAAIFENTAADGSARVGSFLVIVDDGTGFPPPTLLAAAATAVDFVRPIGSTFAVLAPQVLPVQVAITVKFATLADSAPAIGDIQNAVCSLLNGLTIGQSASITRIAQIGYLAASSIENISGILLNGQSSDITPSPLAAIKAGQIVVTIDDR